MDEDLNASIQGEGPELRRLVAFTTLFVCLVVGGLPSFSRKCAAQETTPEYDYQALALASILNVAQDSVKLAEVEERVSLLTDCARILSPLKREEAIGFLDIALRHLRDWGSESGAKWQRRDDAARLRREVLSVYAQLDPTKALALKTEAETDSNADKHGITSGSFRDAKWRTTVYDAQRFSDASAQLGFSLIDTDLERATTLVVQSVATGVVSSFVSKVFLKLEQDRNRPALDKIEQALLPVITSTVALDQYSLGYASILLQSDQGMSPAARRGFVLFLMNSLETWERMVTGADGQGGVDPSYINAVFMTCVLNVRPTIALYSPEDLARVDALLDQVSSLVPEKTRSMASASQPEKLSDPRDRIAEILREPNSRTRDLRLIRLVSEVLRKQEGASQGNLDVASEAIANFSDPDLKTAYGNLLTIARVNALVKMKKFIEAQRVAGSISPEETRVWALLALSRVAAKEDRVLGFELISNALKALDTASPSPHKVELALIATAMLAKDDPQRAFDALSTASRYANSSTFKVDPPKMPPVAFGLDAAIGEAHTKLGVYPETLGELQVDPELSFLATADWFRAEQIANEIREPALRLRLKLHFAEAVLASNPKPKRKDAKAIH